MISMNVGKATHQDWTCKLHIPTTHQWTEQRYATKHDSGRKRSNTTHWTSPMFGSTCSFKLAVSKKTCTSFQGDRFFENVNVFMENRWRNDMPLGETNLWNQNLERTILTLVPPQMLVPYWDLQYQTWNNLVEIKMSGFFDPKAPQCCRHLYTSRFEFCHCTCSWTYTATDNVHYCANMFYRALMPDCICITQGRGKPIYLLLLRLAVETVLKPC